VAGYIQLDNDGDFAIFLERLAQIVVNGDAALGAGRFLLLLGDEGEGENGRCQHKQS